jgi:muramoyltetrapeptide carboxypeptidase
VLLIAPSGWPPDGERYQLGLARLRAAGFQVVHPHRGERRFLRFAGTEDERVQDLNALCDPAEPMPDLVMLPRGGYGAVQLLDRIDYARLCPRLKAAGTVVMGYSDFTALAMALLARGDLVTWSGPMVSTDLGAPVPDPAMVESLRSAITRPEVRVRVDLPQVDAGTFEGRFWGGNLTTLAALAGTPYLPDIRDGLLFLEDDGETPYRVDRMLFQLHHAGILGRQKAILLGAFTGTRPDQTAPDYTLERVVDGFRARTGIPIFTGLPAGHIPGQHSLPVGAQGKVQGGPGGFTLTLTGYPYLRHPPAGLVDPAWPEAKAGTAPTPAAPRLP